MWASTRKSGAVQKSDEMEVTSSDSRVMPGNFKKSRRRRGESVISKQKSTPTGDLQPFFSFFFSFSEAKQRTARRRSKQHEE